MSSSDDGALWSALGAASRTASRALSRAGNAVSRSGRALRGLSSLERRLGALLSASALGYDLVENPQGFVRAVIVESVLDFVLSAVGVSGLTLFRLFDLAGEIVADGLRAAGAPLGGVGDVLVSLGLSLGQLTLDLSNAAGPAAPFVAFVAWAAVVLLVATTFRVVWELFT